MTLLAESCGSQVPSLALYPQGDLDYALADGVLDWLDAIGMTLFEWQRRVLRRALARRGKKWAAYEVDLFVPRQNGKNEILIALELAATNLLGVRQVIHSAHEASTAAKHFKRFEEMCDPYSPAYKPEVAKLFPKVGNKGLYKSNGKEHIEFANGAEIDFRTRTGGGGKGFSAPLVVLDEAFDLPPKAVGSLQYTMRAKPNAQFWKTSSAAYSTSVVMHNDRKRAKAADPDDSRFLYMEWGNEPDCDPSDPETWLQSNPSLGMQAPGFELDLDTFRSEYASAHTDDELLAEFMREVCGVFEPPLSANAVAKLPADKWILSAVDEFVPVRPGSCVMAFDVHRGWAAVSISAGTLGGSYGEVVEYRRGDGWLPSRLAELVRTWKPTAVGVDGGNGESVAVLGAIRELFADEDDLDPDLISVLMGRQYREACAAVDSAVRNGTARRPKGDPDHLGAAGAAAPAKVFGDSWVFDRKASKVALAPLIAWTISRSLLAEPVAKSKTMHTRASVRASL